VRSKIFEENFTGLERVGGWEWTPRENPGYAYVFDQSQ